MSLTFSQASHKYRLDGKSVKGVTSLIGGGLPKPALIKWAPKFVAQIVEEWRTGEWDQSRDQLHADLVEAIQSGRFQEWLSRTPESYRDAKAATGTVVHALGESVAHGRDVDVPDRLLPYVEGYARWLDKFDVHPTLTERPVASRKHWYAGTFDMFATSNLTDGLAQFDLKTSNSVYGSAALQTSAYARAEFFMDGETECPIPDLDATLVVHITPDGSRAHWLCRDRAEIDEAFEDFLRVAAVAQRVNRIDGRWDRKIRRAVGGYLSEPIEIEGGGTL